MSYNEFTLGELSTLYCFQSSISTGRGGGEGGVERKKETVAGRKQSDKRSAHIEAQSKLKRTVSTVRLLL